MRQIQIQRWAVAPGRGSVTGWEQAWQDPGHQEASMAGGGGGRRRGHGLRKDFALSMRQGPPGLVQSSARNYVRSRED